MSKKRVSSIFFGNATINFFNYLHGDRGQHCATFELGVLCQKNNAGISRGLNQSLHTDHQ